VRSRPFPPWPVFDRDEIDVVSSVLASGKVNYWTGGECQAFEQEFAAFCGMRHAISLANGTLALELALYAFEIGRGDEVIVPARTFIASASCAVARGAVPVVADVDPDSQNLTADTIRAVLTPRTRAIVAVHLAGWPCDMDHSPKRRAFLSSRIAPRPWAPCTRDARWVPSAMRPPSPFARTR